MLLGLLVLAVLAGVDALLDRSSRRPLSWKEFRPGRDFWTRRRTKRERAAVAMPIGKAES